LNNNPSAETLYRKLEVDLGPWGWTKDWTEVFKTWSASVEDSLLGQPARILAEQRDYLETVSLLGLQRAESKGRLRRKSEIQPAVGDWVIIDSNFQITAILPRKTCLRRKAAGENEDIQIMATNVDWVFVTTSLNRDFNLRRMERFIVAARDSQAAVALVLTKADLEPNLAPEVIKQVHDRLGDLEVVLTSSHLAEGLDELRKLLQPNKTAVFLGSSGVGKSSLVNALLSSQTQVVSEIRQDDDKGRHTTTGRNSFLLPSGGVIVDSPGIRELQLADGTIRVEDEFSDIEELALKCKFTNCRHENEKGCSIQAALKSGDLNDDRLLSYRKLKAEIDAKALKRQR
jgi:ribosome biogenesis GTPase